MKILHTTIALSGLIIACSLFYFFVLFLPKYLEAKQQQTHEESVQTIEAATNAEVTKANNLQNCFDEAEKKQDTAMQSIFNLSDKDRADILSRIGSFESTFKSIEETYNKDKADCTLLYK
jgi:heme/copper-type cytochrome/quinol oxidase subunit 1